MRRIDAPITPAADEAVVRRHIDYANGLGLPSALDMRAGSERLAVVGASPGLDIAALRSWGDDLWAVNSTASILARHGIASTMVSVDPWMWATDADFVAALSGIERAILGTCCNPRMFDFLLGRGADVMTFPTAPWEKDCINGGTTTATRAAFLAPKVGHREVSFFGLEGCYETQSHVDRHAVPDWHELTIEAGGRRYRSCVELMLQSANLAMFVREFPNVFKDRSGGLLGAMVEHFDDWDVVETSDALRPYLIDKAA